METDFLFDDPEDEINAKPEHTGRVLFMLKRACSWHWHNAPNGDKDIRCMGSRDFDRGELLEATQFEDHGDTVDIELAHDVHLINMPKAFLMFENEIL